MAETAAIDTTEKPRRAPSPVFIVSGLLLLAGAAAGFLAVREGVFSFQDKNKPVAPSTAGDLSELAFVPLDPVIVSLGSATSGSHLRFRAELEVSSAGLAEVERIRPRLVDILNVYLRALKTADLEDPLALHRMRAQILRRMQLVAGPDRVRDVLIMEFVLN